jgi:cell division septal protein FtsQ
MKKIKLKPGSGKENFQLDKLLVAKTIGVIVLTSLTLAVYQKIKRLEVFRVSEVTVRQGGNISQGDKNFAYLVGRNVFDLDLNREARNAAYYYPSYQKVRITRFFPSQLVVDFLERQPLAVIRSSRIFYIDENLVLFEPPQEAADIELPVISGVERYVLGAKYGTRCGAPAVESALNIIKAARANKVVRGYSLKKVDMSGAEDASIFLLVSTAQMAYTKTDFIAPAQVMEVKIGREDTRNKLALLATLLSQVKNNIHNIEYIDLRFKEPVIKFRERT